MWNRIEEILEGFRKEFSYKSAYKWLIVLVIGFMIRADKDLHKNKHIRRSIALSLKTVFIKE